MEDRDWEPKIKRGKQQLRQGATNPRIFFNIIQKYRFFLSKKTIDLFFRTNDS